LAGRAPATSRAINNPERSGTISDPMNNAPPNTSAHDMTANPLPQQTETGSENCLDIGTRVAEFEITGIVGEGGFGIVYLAFDHSLQRTIALKEYMPPALAGRGADHAIAVRSKRHQETFDAGLKSFINEARLLAQFDHPALIKVHRFWEQNNTAYMAMRFYEGRTLKDIIKDEPAIATEAWWKSILKPILEALDVLYNVQILHRDISPENIMIQPTGEPVLLDFGAARQLIQNMAQALTVILKPGYAPIEQYADDPSMQQGPWTDIYALSAVVYSSIAKKAPPASIARLIKDPVEPLTPEDYPGYGRQFLFAISKGFAVKPDDRPQTIAEFSQLLGLDKLERRARDRSSASVVSASDTKKSDRKSEPAVVAKTATDAASGKNRRQSAGTRTTALKASNAFTRRGWIAGAAGIACIAVLGLYAFKTDQNAAPGTAAVPRAETIASANLHEASEHAAAGAAQPVSSSRPTGLPVTVAASHAANKPDGKPARAASPDAGKAAASPQKTAVQPTSAAAEESGTMQLQIKPWGTILVNGVSKGVSPPLKNLVLPEGRHQVRVVNSHYPDHVVDIVITSQKTVRIEHDFSRSKK
jgi:serine/threonine protein kinase